MANIIEEFYYGNIEPQEVNSELTSKLKKKLSNLEKKEEQITARLNGEDKELFQNYVSNYIEFSITSSCCKKCNNRICKFTFFRFLNHCKICNS